MTNPSTCTVCTVVEYSLRFGMCSWLMAKRKMVINECLNFDGAQNIMLLPLPPTGLTLSSPVGTPTHDQDFMFTPIVPATKSSHEDTVPDVLQESEIDVQPLLDSVIPHKTVKGAMNLEDLEGERRKSHDEIVEPEEKKDAETEEREESAEAFVKLVETMKACGNLPEKPTPTVSFYHFCNDCCLLF